MLSFSGGKATEALYQACCELPPDLEKIQRLLETNRCTPTDLTQVAIRLVTEDCFAEDYGFAEEHGRDPERGELHTHYLCDLLQLYLAFGMDPNEIQSGDNVMSSLGYVASGHDAADCMRLLLEHGGDPNLVVEGESIFDYLMYRVNYGLSEYDIDYWDGLVHLWFVLLGFGGKWSSNGKVPVEMKNGYSIEKLRMHEDIAYTLEPWPDKPDCWTMHIIRKDTGEEIAVS